ncbi:hypothetical protein [Stratiformator vulcanicus]|nr:hypothetical protein [Stratiformator vulcanicus]
MCSRAVSQLMVGLIVAGACLAPATTAIAEPPPLPADADVIVRFETPRRTLQRVDRLSRQFLPNVLRFADGKGLAAGLEPLHKQWVKFLGETDDLDHAADWYGVGYLTADLNLQFAVLFPLGEAEEQAASNLRSRLPAGWSGEASGRWLIASAEPRIVVRVADAADDASAKFEFQSGSARDAFTESDFAVWVNIPALRAKFGSDKKTVMRQIGQVLQQSAEANGNDENEEENSGFIETIRKNAAVIKLMLGMLLADAGDAEAIVAAANFDNDGLGSRLIYSAAADSELAAAISTRRLSAFPQLAELPTNALYYVLATGEEPEWVASLISSLAMLEGEEFKALKKKLMTILNERPVGDFAAAIWTEPLAKSKLRAAAIVELKDDEGVIQECLGTVESIASSALRGGVSARTTHFEETLPDQHGDAATLQVTRRISLQHSGTKNEKSSIWLSAYEALSGNEGWIISSRQNRTHATISVSLNDPLPLPEHRLDVQEFSQPVEASRTIGPRLSAPARYAAYLDLAGLAREALTMFAIAQADQFPFPLEQLDALELERDFVRLRADHTERAVRWEFIMPATQFTGIDSIVGLLFSTGALKL